MKTAEEIESDREAYYIELEYARRENDKHEARLVEANSEGVSLWLAKMDNEKVRAAAAELLWLRHGEDFTFFEGDEQYF